MYVRLAFSVSAHLNPDILLLDEVLSVGDAAFQHKSMDKISRTCEEWKKCDFLQPLHDCCAKFVSEAMVLHKGKLLIRTDAHHAIQHYF